jgi:hypothetical protein
MEAIAGGVEQNPAEHEGISDRSVAHHGTVVVQLAPREEGNRRQVLFEKLKGGFAGRRLARCIRALIATLLMFGLGLILVGVFGPPNIPGRGSLAPGVFWRVTLVEVFFTLFLIFLVADATLLSRAFIKRLTAVRTIWPDTALGVFQGRFHLDRAYLADWIDMHYLARRTRSITRIIYFPICRARCSGGFAQRAVRRLCDGVDNRYYPGAQRGDCDRVGDCTAPDRRKSPRGSLRAHHCPDHRGQ